MFCKNCGSKIAENSRFCRFCGSKVDPLEEEIKTEEEVKVEDEIKAEEENKNEKEIKTIEATEKEEEKKEDKKDDKKEDNKDKNIELTDNIDVTKIVLETKNEEKEDKKEESKTQDFEEVLNDINNSIDKMNDDIPSPGETKSAKDKSLEPSKEIKNILEEFESDESKTDNETENDSVKAEELPEIDDLEKTSVIVSESISTAAESDSTEEETSVEAQNDTNELEDTDVSLNTVLPINNETINMLNNNQPAVNTVEKKSKHIVLPIILTIFLVISVAGLVCMFMMYSKSEDKVKSIEKDNKKLEEKIKETETQIQQEEKTTIYLEGYEITLPNNKEVSYINNSLLINLDNSTIYTYIKKNEKYSNIKGSMWKNKSIIENNEYKVSKYGTKVVESREYVVYEIEDTKGGKYIVAYSDLNGKDVVAFVINNKDNNVNGEELTTTNQIVDSLKENKNITSSQIKIFN